LNRVEIISGGRVIAPWLTYFVEWRPVSQEGRSDGSLRDRSGRFEDLFLTASSGAMDLTAGQFRQMGQVDVSRRIGVSEPFLLSASLPGSGTGSSRDIGLRAFSPSGRSPSLRLGLHRQTERAGRWSTYVALPFSGEFSVPLTSEAKAEASNELELNPKGVFVESFIRSGLTSVGAHVFYDSDPDRYLANAVVTGAYRDLHWTGILGVAKSGDVTRGRWSVEGEVFPAPLSGFLGLGGRVEDQGGDTMEHAVIPYLNAHFPGTRYTIRLTLERRLQRDRDATFLEIGTVF
jgi:expansin (peptidoglycan-binding protein)